MRTPVGKLTISPLIKIESTACNFNVMYSEYFTSRDLLEVFEEYNKFGTYNTF